MKSILLGYDAMSRPIRLSADKLKAHKHISGSSGSGKSKLLEWLMRGDLRNRQGFCLIDPHGTLYNAVLDYCAHHVIQRDIILLNLSEPHQVIGFNPFQRAAVADISVQVDRRIQATMHAWNVPSTDQTPTLERTLRLIYTVMLERGIGLPQVRHLIDFHAGSIREQLISELSSPLIAREWQELQQLTRREWREEILSAKNRLFRFLTSQTLCRFMGLPGRTLDLQKIMDTGAVLLVNLAPSDHLSEENARVFGALLINEFFETARRRRAPQPGCDPEPYYLYIDEFQNFVSLDMVNMLDQVRKFGVFLTLAHQRFGQLDEDMTDAVLTNCRIKAVFGGLPIQSAELIAKELFIRELDPRKIKVAIYQTKFWPQYQRDYVYTHGTGSARAYGTTIGDSHSSSSGAGEVRMFQPGDWFLSLPQATGLVRPDSLSRSSNWGTGDIRSFTSVDSTSASESDAVADVPILMPVPFEELSSIQYYTPEEQLIELTAALKEQFQRHCFIKIHEQQTQPMLVPFVKQFYTNPKNRAWYEQWCLSKRGALAADEVERLIEANERALVNTLPMPETPAPPQTDRAVEPSAASPPAKLTRPALETKKKRISTGRRRKDAAESELPEVNITDNPVTSAE